MIQKLNDLGINVVWCSNNLSSDKVIHIICFEKLHR